MSTGRNSSKKETNYAVHIITCNAENIFGLKWALFFLLVSKRLTFAYKLTILFPHYHLPSLYLIYKHVNEFYWYGTIWDNLNCIFEYIFYVCEVALFLYCSKLQLLDVIYCLNEWAGCLLCLL